MTSGVLRHSSRDAILIAVAAGYGALLVLVPSAPLIAIGMWWIANTTAHNFIHLPFFRSRPANTLFSAFLTLLLGVPQELWRERHVAHHAGRALRIHRPGQLAAETVLVIAFWTTLAITAPHLLARAFLPGWAGGLLLCALQGHFEHARGTVSHYGTLYNVLFFNDGFHVEHHARPGLHWSRLPADGRVDVAPSRWPAVFRWLELLQLDALERMVLRSHALQRWVLAAHRSALQRMLARIGPVRRVTIVGGALFPRTALALRQLLPSAELVVVDRSAANIAVAARIVGEGVTWVTASYRPELAAGSDLVVVPLAYDGDRDAFYRAPPAGHVLIHEWFWHRRGQGTIVSLFLLKRLNLISR